MDYWMYNMILLKKLVLVLAIICVHTVTSVASRPLNILFVVAYFPAPSQTYILNMITGLIDKGHHVSIFAFRKNEVIGQPDIEKYSLMDSVIYRTFLEELPECDIVFCQSGRLGNKIIHMASLSEWLKTKKLVVCLRGTDITANVKINPDIYRELFQKAALFLPVCDYFKQRLLALGCDKNKVMVHHSAIDCKKFFFRSRKKIKEGIIHFISVGRLVYKKGFRFAIEAIAEIAKEYENIHFTIIGSGELQSRLQVLAKKLNILDKITFFGWGTQEQVVSLLDRSHIFLLPSITSRRGDKEGIANALKEAMAMGLISIGTWHAGTPELIEDGVSGFLVPEKDSKELAKKIKYIIEHPEIWKSIGRAGRKKIENEFETKKSVEELERIFYQLLA